MKRIAERGLTSNELKAIAILCMLFQHTALILMDCSTPLGQLLYQSGRLTAPIICFFIAEGYHHTSNLKRYCFRLFATAVISHIPHALAFGYNPLDIFHATSIMWSLFLGLVALAVCKSGKLPAWSKALITLACCILSYPGNFNCIAVLWILSFGLFRESKAKQTAAFLLVTFLYYMECFVIRSTGCSYCRFLTIGALPLIYLYNGKRGRTSGLIKYGFYGFYPAHLLVLYFLHLALKA